jgi:hypothetical protein
MQKLEGSSLLVAPPAKRSGLQMPRRARVTVSLAITLAMTLLGACRTALPPTVAIAPVKTASSSAALNELIARRQAFRGVRALARIRAIVGDRRQSFTAQLALDASGRMALIAYTPVGTQALELFASGETVTFVDHLHHSWWRGRSSDFARSFGFFAPSLTLPRFAFLLLGLPVGADTITNVHDVACDATCSGNATEFNATDAPIAYRAVATGLAAATISTDGEPVVLRFMPPSQPPQRVTITHWTESLDLNFQEIGASDEPVVAPVIPGNYTAGVAPTIGE